MRAITVRDLSGGSAFSTFMVEIQLNGAPIGVVDDGPTPGERRLYLSTYGNALSSSEWTELVETVNDLFTAGAA